MVQFEAIILFALQAEKNQKFRDISGVCAGKWGYQLCVKTLQIRKEQSVPQ